MSIASLSGTSASVEEALVFLLIIAAAVAIVARRVGVPYTVGLVIIGLALGLVTKIDAITLSSDLVFYVFLPLLLFEAGFNLEARHLLTEWRRIAALAIPGVLVAFALVGLGVHWLDGTTWTVALLFAALIAATDPVSVVSLFRHLGVSDRLTTMVDGESLFNDGTAAVVFAVVLGWVLGGGHLSAAGAVGQFLWMMLGGFGVGLGMGYGASLVHRFVDDHLVEITLSSVLAYGSFLLGQWLGMSGVVACVTSAVVLGNYGQRRGMSPVTRATMSTVWEYAAFVANSLIFLLIGLRIDVGTITGDVGLVVIGFIVVVASRAVVVYGYGLFALAARRPLPLRWQHVLVWGGLRGTIALALVLSVPNSVAGASTLRVLAFGVVLLSLVVQGLSMPAVARRLGLVDTKGASMRGRRRAALLDGFVMAHEELDRLQETGELPRVERRHLQRTIEEHESILLEGLDAESEEPAEGDDERLSERIGALVAQRRRIAALHHAGALADDEMGELTEEIDRRLALLAERLACEPAEVCDEDGGPLP